MRELILRIRALFEGKAEAQAAERAVEAVADKTGDVGTKAAAAAPKVDAMLEGTRQKAKQATDALEETAQAAKNVGDGNSSGAMSRLDQKFAEVERELAAYERQAESVGKPPPLPEAPGENMGKGLATGVALTGLLVAAAGVKSLIDNLATGSQAAADMAAKLDQMDDASRRAALEGMGPLGEIIQQNSPFLVKYAEDTEKIRQKFDDLWTAAGARLVPALTDVSKSLAEINTVSLGASIGDAAAGAVSVVYDLGAAINSTAESVGIADAAQKTYFASLAGASVQQVFLWEKLKEKGREFTESLASDPSQQLEIANAAATSRAKILQSLAVELGRVQREAALSAMEPEERLLEIRQRQAEALERLKTAQSTPAQAQAANEFAQLEQQALSTERLAEARTASIGAVREEMTLHRDLRQAEIAGDEAAVNAIKERLHYLGILKTVKDEDLAKTLAARDAENAQAEAVKKTAADREKAAKLAALENTAESEKITKLNQANYLKQLQIDLQIALTEAIAAGNAGEAERVRWMQEYTRLMTQGWAEEDARRQANASSGARSATAAARGEDPPPVASASQPLPSPLLGSGRESAPLQRSPFGPSGLDAPVDITNPARPRDLSQELTPKGSEGYGTGPGAQVPGAPDQAGKGDGNAAGEGKAEAAAQKAAAAFEKLVSAWVKALEKITKEAEQATKAAEGQKSAEKIGGLGAAIKRADEELQRQIDDIRNNL